MTSSSSNQKSSERNSGSVRVLKVKTPKKVITKDIELQGARKAESFRPSQAFAEVNPNVIKAERLARIEKIKQILANDGVSGYLKTHSVSAVIQGLSNEVSFIRDMIRA